MSLWCGCQKIPKVFTVSLRCQDAHDVLKVSTNEEIPQGKYDRFKSEEKKNLSTVN